MAWYAYCIVEQQAFQNGIRTRRPVPVENLKGIGDAQTFAYPSGEFSVIVSEYISTGELGQKAGYVGLGAGGGEPQFAAGGEAVALGDREADLRLTERSQIVGGHLVIPPCDRDELGAVVGAVVMEATPPRWPAATRPPPPADPSRLRWIAQQ